MKARIILNADDYSSMGVEKYFERNFPGAIDDFTKAIELGSDDPETYFNRGLANLMLDQRTEALEDFIKVIELGYHISRNMLKLCR